jgi:hypothetical protein
VYSSIIAFVVSSPVVYTFRLAFPPFPASSDTDIDMHSDKVGHCLREAMAERYARSKPAIDKTIPNLVPKPLTCSSSTNDAFASFYPQTTTSLNEARHFCMIDSRPSIVSDADVRDISSQDDDDDSSSFSADSLTSTSIFASDEYFSESNATTEVVDALHELPSEGDKAYTSLPRISNAYSAPTDLAEVVDALYELPSQGEWEELILPRANFAFSGISSFIIV